MASESDIKLVMETFGCDDATAKSLIESGINVEFIKEGLDKVVEPEVNLKSIADKAIDELDALAKLHEDVKNL